MLTSSSSSSPNFLSTDSLLNSNPAKSSSSQAEGVGYLFGRHSVEAAVAAIRRGGMAAVVDDVSRENEGDLIMAAQFATPSNIADMINRTSGILCAAMDGETLDRLQIPPMVGNNQDPRKTPFAVSVDAADGSTGVSPCSRCATLLLLSSPTSTAAEFQRPGHVFPLRCHAEGLLGRQGHTEAAVELCTLAAVSTCAVIGEIKSRRDPTAMATATELVALADEEQLVLTSIQDIICYKREQLSTRCDNNKCQANHHHQESSIRGRDYNRTGG
eukprot:GHVS01042257.1.p1 GENE.GHVS01042257.1~~GHVS01042257.1.p1  ORF type:complete len:272 (-),score=67.89 GHVS01042257.1:214-1029(-)